MDTYKNKMVLVTGASSGIGKAMAIDLAAAGAELILTARSQDLLEALANEIHKNGGQAHVFSVDLAQAGSAETLHTQITEANLHVDILVNNAGINKVSDFLDISEKDWDKIIDTNLKSTFFLTQEIFRMMKKNLNGKIINISSGAALYHGPRTAHYAISKAGMISLTKLVARFGSKYNILSNAIAPGIIKTNLTKKEVLGSGGKNYLDMTLLKKFGSLNDVSNAALYLSSNDQNYITGEVLNITGGAYLG